MNLTEQKFRELQVLARGEGRNTQELLTLYVLEGFLSRLEVTNGRKNSSMEICASVVPQTCR